MSQESQESIKVKEYLDEVMKIIKFKVDKKNSDEYSSISTEVQKMYDKIQPLYDAMDEEEKIHVEKTVLRLEIWKNSKRDLEKIREGKFV